MSKIKEYTNSIQHNVLATAIDNLNDKKGLTFVDENKINTNQNIYTKDIDFKISTLNGMNEILNEIHSLGYKIVKGS